MKSAANVVMHPTARRLEYCRCLARVLRITKQMLDAANRRDWEEVARLEGCRRPDYHQCFSTVTPGNTDAPLQDGLAALVYLNEELLMLLRAHLRGQTGSERDATPQALAQGRKNMGKVKCKRTPA